MGDRCTYTSSDVPDKPTFLERKRDVLNRFIGVIMPLANVYQLPLSSLHLFMDMSGGVIAFNRNGSIFLNLRYYEAWRKLSALRLGLHR